MLARFLHNTVSLLQHRVRVKKAIKAWNHGYPNISSAQVQLEWPVKLWTELLRNRDIGIDEVLDHKLKNVGLWLIKDPDFWSAMFIRLGEHHPIWHSIAPYAIRTGNLPCLTRLPHAVQWEHIHLAEKHPYCKKWFVEHPIYGIDTSFRAMWKPLDYKPHIIEFFESQITHQELLSIVTSNIEFEGPSTADTAFIEVLNVIYKRSNALKLIDRQPANSVYHDPKVYELLQDVWKLTSSKIPFEIRCVENGFMPKRETNPGRYQDCLVILHYCVQHSFWFQYDEVETRDDSVNLLEMYLDLVQPSSRAALISCVGSYYDHLCMPVEQAAWDASFSEI